MLGMKHSIEKDIAMQEKLIAKDEQQLLLFPTGRLKLGNSGRTISILMDNGRYKAADESDELVCAIRKRKFFEKRLEVMKGNIAIEKQLVSRYLPYDMYSVNELLSKAYQLDLNEAVVSNKTDHADSSFHSETLKHQTLDGKLRRSKSELLISMLYEEYGVAYEYEPVLYWPDKMPDSAEAIKKSFGLPDMIRPDFKLKERTGGTIYQEHCGMLGIPEYMQQTMKKLMFYHLLGYTIGDNLIITADSIDGTFNQARIVELIETRLK